MTGGAYGRFSLKYIPWKDGAFLGGNTPLLFYWEPWIELNIMRGL